MRQKYLRLYLFLTLALFIWGCASTPVTVSEFYPITPPDGKAVIYIYRPYVLTGAAYIPKVLDNEKYVTNLGLNKYVTHVVSPGNYIFRTDSMMIDEPLKIEIRAGEIHYLKLDAISGVFNHRFKFTRVFPEQAVEEIKFCEIQARRIVVYSNELQESGYELLNSDEIRKALAGNTVKLRDGNKRYEIHFAMDGKIRGTYRESVDKSRRFSGRWSVSEDNMYCDNLGKEDCTPVYLRGKEIVFKKPDGVLSFIGVLE